jgi:cytochrome P450
MAQPSDPSPTQAPVDPAAASPGFDPFAAYDELPHGLFTDLRRRDPVSRSETGWFVATSAHLDEATRDDESFVSSFRRPGVAVPEDEKLLGEIRNPRHGQVRRVVNTAIAPHRASRVEPWVRDRCTALLAPLLAAGGGDLVEGYAVPLPIQVIAHLIGVPPEHHEQFRAWSNEIAEGEYPQWNRGPAGDGLGGYPGFAGYLDRAIAVRAQALARGDSDGDGTGGADGEGGDIGYDDVITRFLTTEVDGARLNPIEIRTQVAFLILAGNETTRNLLGSLCWRLAADPALQDELRRRPELVPVAVEETLRLDPPIHILIRDCIHARELGGRGIEPGEKVVYGLASANRDECVHEHAHDFRLDRPEPRNHWSFGGGPRICPGASLARMEARVAMEVLLARTAGFRLVEGAHYAQVPAFFANGPAHVEVTIDRERSSPRSEPGSDHESR